jgi:hypothetical protein
VKYLDENIASQKIALSEQDVKGIRDAIESVVITGDRYPPFFAPYSFADTPSPD